MHYSYNCITVPLLLCISNSLLFYSADDFLGGNTALLPPVRFDAAAIDGVEVIAQSSANAILGMGMMTVSAFAAWGKFVLNGVLCFLIFS